MSFFFFTFIVDGNWTSWSDWTSCSQSCGAGFQNRTRNCTNPPPTNGGQLCNGVMVGTKRCNIVPCPGLFPICSTADEFVRNMQI